LTDKIVLAYSGGLDTSVAVRWLADNHKADIIPLLVDVGQEFDRDLVFARARKAGASDVVIVDAKEEFAKEYVLPALQAGALYEGRYPLATALARPLIAKHLVEVAKQHGASAVAHGCTGKGNDQVRFETGVAGLAPDLLVHAPVRDWGMTREQEIVYANEHGIEVPVKSGAAYSFDENLWGVAIEAGPLEDPWVAPTEDPFSMTVAPSPDKEAEEVVVTFESGVPVAIDNQRLDLVPLIAKATEIAGAHGVGRIDMIENRLVGIKSREVYEAPAAALLMTAYRGVEELVSDRDVFHAKLELALKYAEIIYYGLWFSPLREAITAFMDTTAAVVTGEARVRLHQGSCTVVGRRAPASLYDHGLATYESGDIFPHTDAAGFIHLWSLPSKTWSRARQ
jgi:argininosuccinate synthase